MDVMITAFPREREEAEKMTADLREARHIVYLNMRNDDYCYGYGAYGPSFCKHTPVCSGLGYPGES